MRHSLPLPEKVAKLPAAEKLLGAAHIYLWGGSLLSRYDITDKKACSAKLNGTKELWEQLNPEAQQAVNDALPHAYAQRVVCRALSELLEARETTQRLHARLQKLETISPSGSGNIARERRCIPVAYRSLPSQQPPLLRNVS